jgi:glutaredoxin
VRDNQEPEVPALSKLVDTQQFLVLSIGNCPQCEELAAVLGARGVPEEVFVKWDKAANEYQALKESLAAYAGEVFTFPQVFAEGKHQGGFKEVMEKVDAGAFDDLFEREFSVEPSTLRRWIERKPMVSFSLPDCPQCDTLYEDLLSRGVPAQDVFIKLDKAQPEYANFKAQLQRLTGKDSFTFPLTFVEGVYQGNFDEVIAKADQGEYADAFAKHFGVQPPAPKEMEQPAPEAIAFDDDF